MIRMEKAMMRSHRLFIEAMSIHAGDSESAVVENNGFVLSFDSERLQIKKGSWK